MAVYLITYDLNNESNRPPIVERIRKWREHIRLSESSYAIVSQKSAHDVYKLFEDMIDEDDFIWIIPMHQPYAGYGPQETIDWLGKHLPFG